MISDWSGEDVSATFYEQELQAVSFNENAEFYVEKFLRKRTRNKIPEVLVRWLHW